jgi:hypothetical protein
MEMDVYILAKKKNYAGVNPKTDRVLRASEP